MSYAPIDSLDERANDLSEKGNERHVSSIFPQEHAYVRTSNRQIYSIRDYLEKPLHQHQRIPPRNPLHESTAPQNQTRWHSWVESVPPTERSSFSEKPCPQITIKPVSSVTSKSVIISRWAIGWRTPTLIFILYIIATALACGHLAFFHWLDGHHVDKVIRQSYATATSTAFVTAFGLSLSGALTVSYTQILWRLLRVRPMSLSTIDSLFSITSTPWKLASPDVVRNAPHLCICAMLCWCIPIAMIYPPGAVIVKPRAFQTTSYMSVPTFDPTFRGNGTWAAMQENMLFSRDSYNNYIGPEISVSRVAKQTMLAGTYQTLPSPCGQNCSYTLNVIGPSFECTDRVDFDIVSYFNRSGLLPGNVRETFIFLAAPDYGTGSGEADRFGADHFEIQWRGGPHAEDTSMKNLSCFARESSYTMNLSYVEGRQTVTAQLHEGSILNNSFMAINNAFDVTCAGVASTCMITDSTFSVRAGNVSLPELFRRSNVAAVKDTIVGALSGVLTTSVRQGPVHQDTMIDGCAGLSSGTRDPTFSLSAAALQSLLQNVTISMLTLGNANIIVPATQTNFINVYSFAHPNRLILPYFLCLLASLIFIVVGMVALLRNGVAASVGGFMQILCTTTGSEELDKAVAGGCLGGVDNVPKELKNLKVQYGELVNVGKEDVVRRAGFGVVGEVTVLDKARMYGG